MTEGRLANEIVVVTGAATGIGYAIAEKATREGAAVALLDIQGDAVRRAADALAEKGATVFGYDLDVTDEASVADAVTATTAALGSPSILVNNAGRNAYSDARTMSTAEWEAVFAVDLRGAWLMARAVLPSMVDHGRGSIVNIASLHAKLTCEGMFPYAAAKSGLVGLTRSLALDMAGHGVRVNSVSPGYIRTALVSEYFDKHPDPAIEAAVLAAQPFHRLGDPSEVANVVCFLASNEAGYVTGADWAVDGGLGVRFA